MILVSGFNVYPNEIESVAAAHPGVLEVAAVAQPDENSGEVVALFVVKKDPSLTADALIAYCRTELTGYKVPKTCTSAPSCPSPTSARSCAGRCATNYETCQALRATVDGVEAAQPGGRWVSN